VSEISLPGEPSDRSFILTCHSDCVNDRYHYHAPRIPKKALCSTRTAGNLHPSRRGTLVVNTSLRLGALPRYGLTALGPLAALKSKLWSVLSYQP